MRKTCASSDLGPSPHVFLPYWGFAGGTEAYPGGVVEGMPE